MFNLYIRTLTLCILVPLLAAQQQARLHGVVRDQTGATVRNAGVEIRSAGGSLLSVRRTDSEGRFDWPEARPGPMQLRVSGLGFAASETVLYLREQAEPVEIILKPESVYTRVTVNATRGIAEEAIGSPHVALIIDRDDILKRPGATLGNVARAGARHPGPAEHLRPGLARSCAA